MSTYTDNFQRANENPLAAPWVWFGGYFQLLNDLIEPQFGESDGNYGGAYMYQGPFLTDQWSEITAQSAVGVDSSVQALVRMLPASVVPTFGNSWYSLNVQGTLGGSVAVGLEKYRGLIGGSYLARNASIVVNSGDVLKITAVGNVITGYLNGTQILQATDSDLPFGWVGVGAFANSLASDAQISAWSGGGPSISGNVGVAGATVTLGVLTSPVTTKSTTSASDGSYSFVGLADGNYTVTPSLSGYIFGPTSRNETISGFVDITNANFTAEQVLSISTSSLPSGIVALQYDQTIEAIGGIEPYDWSIFAFNLPPGLSLNPSTGEIVGTPTDKGTFNFDIQVTDSSSPVQTWIQGLSIEVVEVAPVIGSFDAYQQIANQPRRTQAPRPGMTFTGKVAGFRPPRKKLF